MQWRRSVNTANTQAVNAANEANAANLLNLSNFGMSALWQQWRDEASWVNTASQNDLNRNHNLAIAALERTTAFRFTKRSTESCTLWITWSVWYGSIFRDDKRHKRYK